MGDGQDQDLDLDPGGRGPKFADLLDPAGTLGRPVAATLADVAELLGVEDLAAVERAAAQVPPYVHADGSPRWSVALLERELGRRRGGTPWRAQNRASYRHEHSPDP